VVEHLLWKHEALRYRKIEGNKDDSGREIRGITSEK
jgi:hypothetical protein